MLAIDPMTIANGCVRFVDGSHTGGPQPHVHVDSASFSLAIDGSPTAFPEATPVECEPGDAVFFGPLVGTRSQPRPGLPRPCFAKCCRLPSAHSAHRSIPDSSARPQSSVRTEPTRQFVQVIHGSQPNTSSSPRRANTFAFDIPGNLVEPDDDAKSAAGGFSSSNAVRVLRAGGAAARL